MSDTGLMTSGPDIGPILDTIHALIGVMEEESETLALQGPTEAIGPLADAKARLVARLDTQVATLTRAHGNWQDALPPDARGVLIAAYEDLHNAGVVNSDILERQIALSSEMLAAVGLEIERLTGRGAKTYGRCGGVREDKGKAPLSINTKL